MGVLDVIGQDYSNLEFDINRLREKMASPEDLKLLKDIMTKLA